MAYYPFNGNADDESGNENHGTVYGATLTEDRFGNADSAYYFDGTNDYIEIPSVNPTSAITVSAWVKSVSSSSYSGHWQIVSKYHAYILGVRTPNSNDMCFIIHIDNKAWQYGSCYRRCCRNTDKRLIQLIFTKTR